MKPRIATYKGFSRIIKQWVFGDLIHNALVNGDKDSEGIKGRLKELAR